MTAAKKATPKKAAKAAKARKPRKAAAPKSAPVKNESVATNVAPQAGPRVGTAVKPATATERAILEQFRAIIRTARLRLEISEKQLAEEAELTDEELDALDPASSASPTLSTLCRAAEALQLNASLNIPI